MGAISVSLAFGYSFLASTMIGWILAKRYRFAPNRAATLAFGVAVGLSIPILMSSGISDLFRIVKPREAVDWLSISMLIFAVVGFLLPRPIGQKWYVAAPIVCVVLCARMLFGSVYLRSGQYEWLPILAMVAWGLVLSLLWVVGDREEWPWRWWDGFVCGVIAATTAMAIAMSGSFTYGAATGTIAIAMLGCLLSTGRVPSLSLVPLGAIAGLSFAFAKLGVVELFVFGIAMVTLAGSRHVTSDRWRAAVMILVVVISSVGGGLVAKRFVDDMTTTENSYGGYEAYK